MKGYKQRYMRQCLAAMFACVWGFAGLLNCQQAHPDNLLDSSRDPVGYYLLFQLTELLSPFGGSQALGISFSGQPTVSPGIFSDAQASVVFNGQVFLIGAGNGRQIYSSSEGSLWTLQTQDVFPGGRFNASALTFNGRIFVVGGSDANGSIVPASQSVWSSTDGVNWTNAAPGCVTCPGSGYGFVFQSQLWFLDASGATVLSSPDGATWTATATNVVMTPINVLVFKNAVYAFEDRGTAWTSSDGFIWNRLSFDVGPPRSGFFRHGTVFENRMWLFEDFDSAAGVSAQDPPAAIYLSGVFSSWRLVDFGCCMRRHFSTPYSVEVLNDRIWLIGTRLDAGLLPESGVSLSTGGGTGVDGSGRTDFSL